MTKHIIAPIIAFLLLAVLAACGEKSPAPSDTAPATSPAPSSVASDENSPTAAPTTDLSAMKMVEPDEADLLPPSPRFPEPTRLEAEDATIVKAVDLPEPPAGFSGKGAVKAEKGTIFTFKANAPVAGNYQIAACYVSEYAAGILTITANGTALPDKLTLPRPDNLAQGVRDISCAWALYAEKEFTVPLVAGENTIVLETIGDEFVLDYISFDQMTAEQHITALTFPKAENPALPFDLAATVSDTGRITALVPADVDLKSLKAAYTVGDDVTHDINLDCTATVTLYLDKSGTLTEQDPKLDDGNRAYTISIQHTRDTKLPSFAINLTDPTDLTGIASIKSKASMPADRKELKVAAMFGVYTAEQNELWDAAPDANLETADGVTGTVKLRGNTSLSYAKKSFKLKFDEKIPLLDLPAQKNWVLLPNTEDKSLLRNLLGYELSRAFDGLEWAPRARGVHLYVDGAYWGVYLLGEHVRQDENRVDIQKLPNKDDPEDLTGGYLLQLTRRAGEAQFAALFPDSNKFETQIPQAKDPAKPGDDPVDKNWLVIEQPGDGDITAAMKDYVQTDWEDLMATLKKDYDGGFATREYAKRIDEVSFVDWLLVNEIFKTIDSDAYASIFLYKEAKKDGGLWKMGPAWDFDISAGDANYFRNNGKVEDFWITEDHNMWYSLMNQDPVFLKKIQDRYVEMLPQTKQITSLYLNNAWAYYRDAADDNNARWRDLTTYAWPQIQIFPTYYQYYKQLADWLPQRLDWLSENLPKANAGS